MQPISDRISDVIGCGALYSDDRVFAVYPSRVARDHPIMLPVSAFPQPGRPTPLSIDAREVAIHRQPGPVRGHDHA